MVHVGRGPAQTHVADRGADRGRRDRLSGAWPTTSRRLQPFFAQLPPAHAGGHRGLRHLVVAGGLCSSAPAISPCCPHPKQTKAIAAARLKNDRVDAERLALLLRGDLSAHGLDPARRLAGGARTHPPPRPARLAPGRGPQSPARDAGAPQSAADERARAGSRCAASASCRRCRSPSIPATIRDDCHTLLPLLDEQIRRLDEDLRQRWGNDPRVQRLLTIPGVGPFIAITPGHGARRRPPLPERPSTWPATSGSRRACARVPTGCAVRPHQ